MNWWQIALIGLGGVALWRWLIWPLLYVALYGIGYSVLHVIVLNWQKARKRPFWVLYLVFIRWPFSGMLQAITRPASSIKIDSWEWEPLFRYRKAGI